MSSFLVSDATINNVLGWLNHRDNRHELTLVLEVAGIEATDPEWPDKLGASMRQLNIDATNARYKDKDSQAAGFEHEWTNVSAVQAYKSLRCWLYQCAEGDIDSRPLYIVFDYQVSQRIAADVIHALPQFDKAVWG